MDVLADPAQAPTWLHEHGVSEVELDALVAARDLLQAVVRGTAAADTLGPLLRKAALRATATTAGLSWDLDVEDAERGAVRVVLAWDALRINSPGRLRTCANHECRRFLIDRSKPNTARWCSMATCGNRMKARRHYERTKTTP